MGNPLPQQIFPQSMPWGTTSDGKDVIINENWWLLLYQLIWNSIGGGQTPDAIEAMASVDTDTAESDSAVLQQPIMDLQALTTDPPPDAVISPVGAILELQDILQDPATTAFANPSALVGLTAVDGVANTAMRSDAAPAIDQTIAPVWTALHTFNTGIQTAQITITGHVTQTGGVTNTFNSAIQITGGLGVHGATAPSQVTGFGTPTGAAVVANFPGASATLVQCSESIAELITILKAYGIIGN